MRTKLLFTVVPALLLATQAFGLCESAPNTICVTGTGKVTAKPDVAYVTVYAKGVAESVPESAQKADQTAIAVEKAIKEKHREVKSISLTDVDVSQVDYWGPEQKQEQRVQVSKQIRVTLPPDASNAYKVIETAVHAGAVAQVQNMSMHFGDYNGVIVYGLIDGSAAEAQSMKQALADAKAKADKFAEMVGKKVGNISHIGESDTSCGPDFSYGRSENYPTKHLSSTPDKIEVTSTVHISYEFLK